MKTKVLLGVLLMLIAQAVQQPNKTNYKKDLL